MDRRLEPELDRDRFGALRLVAPRPASKLFSRDGERAQMNAWNDDTVNTPSLLRVLLVPRDTCVSSDCCNVSDVVETGIIKIKGKIEERFKMFIQSIVFDIDILCSAF